jgi:hypothetical protein
MESKTSLEVVNTSNPFEGKDEHKLEYIKGLISIAQEDVKHVMLYITLSLGIIVLIITQITIQAIRSLPLWVRLITFAGIILECAASYFFFLYIRNLHITQMRMTRCIVSLDAQQARELWAGDAGVWQKNKWKYNFGLFFMICGIVCFGTVLFYLLVFAFVPIKGQSG